MSQYIDTSVYPDTEAPAKLIAPELKEDYLQRIIGAFDRGISPKEATLQLLAGWQDVSNRVPLLQSPAYHALRSYFGWPAFPREKPSVEPTYRTLDALERREDGFEDRM